jgi:hypothetical protein
MKTRIMLGALLIMAAVIGSSVGVGYAGSDGGGAGSDNPNILLYQCYGVVQGSNPPSNGVLELNGEFTDPTVQQVGKLKLLCTLTDWKYVGSPQGTGLTLVQNTDHITCYEVSQAQATQSVVTVNDAFGEQTVTVLGPSKFVCALATCEGVGTRACPFP